MIRVHFIGGPWDGKGVEVDDRIAIRPDEVGVRTDTGWHLYKPIGDTVDGKIAMLYWGIERH